jgi:2-keto-4-pentenoate hydratase/2-oxohepta-3-ene-1,7-dioic acid hydratase in catechol pathway
VRLARFRVGVGPARLGAVEDDEVVEFHGLDGDQDAGVVAALGATAGGERHPLSEVELMAPVKRPPKFLGIGLNYAAHVDETGRDRPEHPTFFNKQSTCVIGPGAPIHVPRVSQMVDYEGELGMVVGRRCRAVPAERAAEVVAGYLVVNDVSARDWQYRAPTWTLGKSFDTHGPIGPWLVTPDELGDPQALGLRTFVNGELRQEANTSEMLFTCYEQIATLSTVFTLEPGDIVATGTPAGVGMARTPPTFLQPGDVVRIEIERIGTLENPVVAEPAEEEDRDRDRGT